MFISFAEKCSIPVFEGLLPEPYNSVLLDLLFTLAEWHALAKLRIHTESTLSLLQFGTRSLGQLLRRFKSKVCDSFDTKELPKEEAARGRRHARRRPGPNVTAGKKQKPFNWITYKFHALGDYVPAIRWFGTTDSYSTQTVTHLVDMISLLC